MIQWYVNSVRQKAMYMPQMPSWLHLCVAHAQIIHGTSLLRRLETNCFLTRETTLNLVIYIVIILSDNYWLPLLSFVAHSASCLHSQWSSSKKWQAIAVRNNKGLAQSNLFIADVILIWNAFGGYITYYLFVTDLLTVNETSVEPPQDDGNSLNSPRNLALEATFINHNFSQQVLKTVTQILHLWSKKQYMKEHCFFLMFAWLPFW
jgi:hypothetical protein